MQSHHQLLTQIAPSTTRSYHKVTDDVPHLSFSKKDDSTSKFSRTERASAKQEKKSV